MRWRYGPRVTVALFALMAASLGGCASEPADALDGASGDGGGGGGDALAGSARCMAGQALVDGVDPARMRADLEALIGLGERGTHDSQTKAAAYLQGRLAALGGLTLRQQRYDYGGKPYVNLEATIAGTSRADEVVLAGAHYDSTSSDPAVAPGADDNASGIAAVLELARLLSQCRPDRSIRLLFFSNEEKGTIGSKAYVQSIATALPPAKVIGYVNVDMVGYARDAAEDLDVATRPAYRVLAETVAAAVQRWSSLKVKQQIDEHCG